LSAFASGNQSVRLAAGGPELTDRLGVADYGSFVGVDGQPSAVPGTDLGQRTSNPIESVFATVRHRTVRTKGALSQDTARLMVFKLVTAAAKTWCRLKGENQLPKVVQGVKFTNGVEVTDTLAQNAA
jgi:hypothetical protein